MKKYDIIIVGSGLTGALIAYKNKDKKVLVLEKNNHIGGFCYTHKWRYNIDIHMYGPHIFHTNKKEVWDFVNSIEEFLPFNLNVKAKYKDKIYSLPFNMNTFYQLWGVTTPKQAKLKVETNKQDIIETFIRGYTEKQWKRPLEEVSPDIINRLPFRYTWDNNYYYDKYVGIPKNGYTSFIQKLLQYSEVKLNTNFLDNKQYWESLSDKIYYTGTIDSYYDYCYGKLEYRYLKFEHKILNIDNYQGCPTMNYTEKEIPWTRIIEHKHFLPYKETKQTWITREYPETYGEPAYPINDTKNMELHNKYKSIKNEKVKFVGRLGEYKYYDMDDIIEKYM